MFIYLFLSIWTYSSILKMVLLKNDFVVQNCFTSFLLNWLFDNKDKSK